MLPSTWADRNPLALRAGLDRSIRVAWHLMHRYRRERSTASFRQRYLADRAEQERWRLITLLDIRKGAA